MDGHLTGNVVLVNRFETDSVDLEERMGISFAFHRPQSASLYRRTKQFYRSTEKIVKLYGSFERCNSCFFSIRRKFEISRSIFVERRQRKMVGLQVFIDKGSVPRN